MRNMIVAYDRERAIGKDGGLLWQSGEMREDMKRFRELTRDTTVIMGRKTLESIGMALPKRRNIVVSSSDVTIDGVERVSSLGEAYDISKDDATFVIGGAQIYEAALPDVDRIYATEVDATIQGADTYFPPLTDDWKSVDRQSFEADDQNIYPYSFATYEKAAGFVNLKNARTNEQRSVMEKISDNKECPFCPENLEKYHTQEVLKKGKDWILTPNQWPYDHTETHLIAIPTYHAETLNDLKHDSFTELLTFMQWAEREYDVRSGAIAMRFGDTMHNGASVQHLHCHFIIPERGKPADVKVRFKIG